MSHPWLILLGANTSHPRFSAFGGPSLAHKSASIFISLRALSLRRQSAGFTLVELVVVILIISAAAVLITVRSGNLDYWQQESFVRKLTDTVEYLHHQAVQDGEHYALEFNFKERFYRVGVLKAEELDNSSLTKVAAEAGALSLELAAVLNPSLGAAYTMIPPPSYPSLFEPVVPPEGVEFIDLTTIRGFESAARSERGDIIFSPRGFSEFAVLHLQINGAPATLLVNPFNGLTEFYRDFREFKWTYKLKED